MRVHVYMWLCARVYVCVCVPVILHVGMRMCVHEHVHEYEHLCLCAQVPVGMCVCAHLCMQAQVPMRMRELLRVHDCVCANERVCSHTHTNILHVQIHTLTVYTHFNALPGTEKVVVMFQKIRSCCL